MKKKDPAAVALGRRGGAKKTANTAFRGVASLSRERQSEIAMLGVKGRQRAAVLKILGKKNPIEALKKLLEDESK